MNADLLPPCMSGEIAHTSVDHASDVSAVPGCSTIATFSGISNSGSSAASCAVLASSAVQSPRGIRPQPSPRRPPSILESQTAFLVGCREHASAPPAQEAVASQPAARAHRQRGPTHEPHRQWQALGRGDFRISCWGFPRETYGFGV